LPSEVDDDSEEELSEVDEDDDEDLDEYYRELGLEPDEMKPS
jgi:hypothetical protein